jgi:hypothetical protein
MFATQTERHCMEATDSGFENSFAPEKSGLRSFVSQASKSNTFYMKIGSIAAGAVILSLIGATGWVYYKDRQARATVPAAPPVDAIISPLRKPEVEQVTAAAPEAGASAPVAAASAPALGASAPVALVPPPAETTVAIDELSKRVDGMQTQVDGVNKVIADLQKQVNAQAIRLRAVTTGKTADKTEEVTEMKVTQISQNSVDVMVGLKKYTVASGGKLPGGATYIGFDVAKSTMRTDRGDFIIN